MSRLAHEVPQAGTVGVNDAGMGDHGQATRAADQMHSGSEPQSAPVDVGGRAAAQKTLKGLADGAHVGAAQHDLGNVRPPDGPVASHLGELGRRQRIAEPAQLREYPGVALVAAVSLFFELGAELLGGWPTQEVTQHVQAELLEFERHLHSGHHLDAETLPGGERLVHAADGVVVGDGHGGEALAGGVLDQLRGRHRAV